MRTFLIVALVALSTATGTFLDFLEPPKHDGLKRVQVLSTEAEVVSATSLNSLVVVLLGEEAVFGSFGEDVALTLAQRQNPVPVLRVSETLVKDALSGQIIVFHAAKKYTYFGRRRVSTMVRFLSSLETAATKTIAGKLDKIAFDQVRTTKLVGYFVNGTPEHQVFEQASSLFSPMVHFYTVFDAVAATHMKLNATGQLGLYREFDRYPVPCGANPASLADIQKCIVLNRDTAVIKITEFNMYDPSVTTPSSSCLLLVTDNSPLAFYLRKLLTRAIRNTTVSTRILWLDSQDFPVVSEISATKNLLGLTTLPGLGRYDSVTNTAGWFDLSVLNLNVIDRVTEEANLLWMKTELMRVDALGAATSAQQGGTQAPGKTEL